MSIKIKQAAVSFAGKHVNIFLCAGNEGSTVWRFWSFYPLRLFYLMRRQQLVKRDLG